MRLRESPRLFALAAFVAGLGLYDLLDSLLGGDLSIGLTALFTGIIAIGTLASLSASRQGLRQQQASSEAQLRAYVLPARGVVEPWGKDGVRFEVAITNHGSTPAIEVAWRAALHQLSPGDETPSPPLTTQVADRIGLYGPGQSESFSRVLPGARPLKPSHRLHVVGEVRYQDIFGEFHVSRFNWLIREVPGGYVWSAAPEGNELRTEISGASFLTEREAARFNRRAPIAEHRLQQESGTGDSLPPPE